MFFTGKDSAFQTWSLQVYNGGGDGGPREEMATFDLPVCLEETLEQIEI
jgi:hypothetical protein